MNVCAPSVYGLYVSCNVYFVFSLRHQTRSFYHGNWTAKVSGAYIKRLLNVVSSKRISPLPCHAMPCDWEHHQISSKVCRTWRVFYGIFISGWNAVFSSYIALCVCVLISLLLRKMNRTRKKNSTKKNLIQYLIESHGCRKDDAFMCCLLYI